MHLLTQPTPTTSSNNGALWPSFWNFLALMPKPHHSPHYKELIGSRLLLPIRASLLWEESTHRPSQDRFQGLPEELLVGNRPPWEADEGQNPAPAPASSLWDLHQQAGVKRNQQSQTLPSQSKASRSRTGLSTLQRPDLPSRPSHLLRTELCSSKSHTETLTPKVRELGGGACGRGLGLD